MTTAPSLTTPSLSTPRWVRRVRVRVALADALAVYTALFAAVAVAVRYEPDQAGADRAATSLALMAGWLAALWLAGSLSLVIMGAGPHEFARVTTVTLAVFGTALAIAYLGRWDLGRVQLVIALPLGILLLGAGRLVMRRTLVAERRAGQHLTRALVMGSRRGVEHLIADVQRTPQSGVDVVAACTDGGGAISVGQVTRGGAPQEVPVVGEVLDAVDRAARHHVDFVLVAGSDHVPPKELQRLAWRLEPHGTRLVVSAGLTDVAPNRVRVWPIPGTPLVHVKQPGFTAPHWRLKRAFDVVASAALIVAFALPLAVTALAIRLTSEGPALFRQTRVGAGGKHFQVLKFRSMVLGAEARLHDVLDGDDGVYYKVEHDPRVTRVGAFIRRYSIDELPQLFNVLAGSMSLVGPRPLTPYDHTADVEMARRTLVKPGMTGLWQVSGRSALTPEHSVRLDVYYVENWSMVEDLRILLRTLRAVVAHDGAY